MDNVSIMICESDSLYLLFEDIQKQQRPCILIWNNKTIFSAYSKTVIGYLVALNSLETFCLGVRIVKLRFCPQPDISLVRIAGLQESVTEYLILESS